MIVRVLDRNLRLADAAHTGERPRGHSRLVERDDLMMVEVLGEPREFFGAPHELGISFVR